MNTYKRLILTYTPEINPYYFSYDESKISNDIINITDEDFKILKNITKTTRSPYYRGCCDRAPRLRDI